MDQNCFRPDCKIGFRQCAPCRGRKVLEKCFGGNVAKVPGNYALDFDARKQYDREELAPALSQEFGLMVEVEEIPGTFEDFDKFCLRIISEPGKRDPKRKFIYVA